MFVETYYDEKTAIPASAGEPVIPYPELIAEELSLWQRYLPIKRDIASIREWLSSPPGVALAEIRKAEETRLFDRLEIWGRSDPDPMVVGISSRPGETTRYYSIVRWGDAAITLAQMKKRLRLEELLTRALPFATGLLVIGTVVLSMLHG